MKSYSLLRKLCIFDLTCYAVFRHLSRLHPLSLPTIIPQSLIILIRTQRDQPPNSLSAQFLTSSNKTICPRFQSPIADFINPIAPTSSPSPLIKRLALYSLRILRASFPYAVSTHVWKDSQERIERPSVSGLRSARQRGSTISAARCHLWSMTRW